MYDDDLLFLTKWPEHYPPERSAFYTFRVALSVRTDQRCILTSTFSHPLRPRSFFFSLSFISHPSLLICIYLRQFLVSSPIFLSYSYNLNSEKHQNTEQWCTNPTIHLSRPSSPVGQRRARLWRRGPMTSATRCVPILGKSGKEGNVGRS